MCLYYFLCFFLFLNWIVFIYTRGPQRKLAGAGAEVRREGGDLVLVLVVMMMVVMELIDGWLCVEKGVGLDV